MCDIERKIKFVSSGPFWRPTGEDDQHYRLFAEELDKIKSSCSGPPYTLATPPLTPQPPLICVYFLAAAMTLPSTNCTHYQVDRNVGDADKHQTLKCAQHCSSSWIEIPAHRWRCCEGKLFSKYQINVHACLLFRWFKQAK